MSHTKRVSPDLLSAALFSGGGGGGGSPATKLQFPPLPPEWEGKYIPGQMYKYQASLPKLPVPPLQQTLDKYITTLEPLLSSSEWEHTKGLVSEFGKPGGVGEILQKLLEKRAEEKDNWLFEWWCQVAYLSSRLPLVVHSSAGMGYPLMPAKNIDQFTRLAAMMILYSVKWTLLIKHEAVPTDFWGKPLCMSQIDMCSKCRIPHPDVDWIRHTPISDSKHVIVISNGHFFKLDVLYECEDGTLAVPPASHIIQQLHNIIKMTSEPSRSPVGILTSEHRDTWAKARERLIMDPKNHHSLDVIEKALFVTCLDKAHPHTSHLQSSSDIGALHDHHKAILANNILHGNGSQLNGGNRWFDHAYQLFIGEDGMVGSLLEHSVSDGSSINMHMVILNTLKRGYDILSEPSPVPANVLCPVEKLQWKLSTDSAQDIQVAKKNLDSLVEDVDLQVITFEDFGKDVPKRFMLSPDGFFQNAIQLAYHKLFSLPPVTYESASTRQFYKGRTDVIRPCTNDALTFVKTLVNSATTVEEKKKSMEAAVLAHSVYALDAVSGHAIDRHLLGLRLIAQKAGMEIPDLFRDEAYLKSNHFTLSTSQLPTFNHDVFVCFGAVVPDGYGVSYCLQDHRIVLVVSSFRSDPKTDSMLFGAKLMESMREMQAVLVAANGLSAAKL